MLFLKIEISMANKYTLILNTAVFLTPQIF